MHAELIKYQIHAEGHTHVSTQNGQDLQIAPLCFPEKLCVRENWEDEMGWRNRKVVYVIENDINSYNCGYKRCDTAPGLGVVCISEVHRVVLRKYTPRNCTLNH